MDHADVIRTVCRALDTGSAEAAAAVVRQDWAFEPAPVVKRGYGPRHSTPVFMRDGFIDRYSGGRLIFPPVLRVISSVLPAEFPFHTNWKTDVTHPAFNELSATIDHVIPVTRGGQDAEANWVTTSMARNFAKMNSTLEEIGWLLHLPGRVEDWDGMMGWFMNYITTAPQLLQIGSIRRWFQAAQEALKKRQPTRGDG